MSNSINIKKKVGLPPFSLKEKEASRKEKYKQLLDKMNPLGERGSIDDRLLETKGRRLAKTGGMERLKGEDEGRYKINKYNASEDKLEREKAEYEEEERKAYESIFKGRHPSSKKLFKDEEDEDAWQEYLERERRLREEEQMLRDKTRGTRLLAASGRRDNSKETT